jgi:hypothetical protein
MKSVAGKTDPDKPALGPATFNIEQRIKTCPGAQSTAPAPPPRQSGGGRTQTQRHSQ